MISCNKNSRGHVLASLLPGWIQKGGVFMDAASILRSAFEAVPWFIPLIALCAIMKK